MRKSRLVVFSLGLVLTGCNNAATAPPEDLAPRPDLNNCQETNSCPCEDDTGCAGNPAGPRCDIVNKRCVACLPAADNCANGQVCQQVNGEYVCVGTCQANADCQKVGGGSTCCKGVCVNLASDVRNCGTCGANCPAVPHGSAGCSSGTCIIAACDPGFDDCDKAVINGCEVETNKDTANCGKCGNACTPFSNGLPTCTLGVCSAICGPGFADCNNTTNDGCEVDTTFDSKNCGGCGKVCVTPPNADPACDQGKCSYRCKPGFADCDGNPANGCEVNNNNDGNHCGRCGNICPLRPNAMASACTNGQCTNTCNMGFGDCDNKPENGCEADLQSSLAACGACGKPCLNQNAVATCSKGMCTLQCAAGYADCNMDGKDGCESKLLEDAKNCGGCGNVCPQNNPFCAKGMCGQTPPYPPLCSGDKDVSGSNYIICAMTVDGAWITANNNGGGCTYSALNICKKYNYTRVTRWGSTCGTLCGYCGAAVCLVNNTGPGLPNFALGGAYTTFDSGGGNPAGGANISCTVHWECAP